MIAALLPTLKSMGPTSLQRWVPEPIQFPSTLTISQGIVFANFGYRLSLWAFPHAAEIAEAGETQNFGLLDTRAAVEWLRDNVKQFGGDPTKITLGGTCSGEIRLVHLLMHPQASRSVQR